MEGHRPLMLPNLFLGRPKANLELTLTHMEGLDDQEPVKGW